MCTYNKPVCSVEALKNGDDDVARMKESYNQRRNYLVHELRDMGLDCFEPYGAFYVSQALRSLDSHQKSLLQDC